MTANIIAKADVNASAMTRAVDWLRQGATASAAAAAAAAAAATATAAAAATTAGKPRPPWSVFNNGGRKREAVIGLQFFAHIMPDFHTCRSPTIVLRSTVARDP